MRVKKLSLPPDKNRISKFPVLGAQFISTGLVTSGPACALLPPLIWLYGQWRQEYPQLLPWRKSASLVRAWYPLLGSI